MHVAMVACMKVMRYPHLAKEVMEAHLSLMPTRSAATSCRMSRVPREIFFARSRVVVVVTVYSVL
jgi:hypothetical protein